MTMQLTDEDRAAIDAAEHSFGDLRCHLTAAYLAGKAAGARAMREAAAKVCETSAHPPTLPADETTVAYVAAAIRALPIPGEP